MAFLVDQVLEQQQKQFIDIVPGVLQVGVAIGNDICSGCLVHWVLYLYILHAGSNPKTSGYPLPVICSYTLRIICSRVGFKR